MSGEGLMHQVARGLGQGSNSSISPHIAISLRDRLKHKRDMLLGQLEECNKALHILEANEEFETLIDAIQRVGVY